MKGIKFGVLVCNDMWVTPGFTDGPDPHLSLQQAKLGAQVIFHSIGTGNKQQYRPYHESNLIVRAAESKCPIVALNGFRPDRINAASGVIGTDYRDSSIA